VALEPCLFHHFVIRGAGPDINAMIAVLLMGALLL
jgi:hypothetical protein